MGQYDLIIVGGGAGAFAAAIKANELGARTALINSGLPLGGTCVNVGCVPSKTLLHAAELLHTAKHHNVPGIELAVNKVDYATVVADELELVGKLRNEKYEQVLKGLDNVTFIEGRAVFVSNNMVKVGEQQIEAAKFIIATGSTAIVPNVEGLAEAGYITHIEAMQLKTVPKRLAIIGAGPVGLELGQLYARFGSQVTILQRAASIMPSAEPILTERLQKILTDEGVSIKTNVQLTKVTAENGVKTVFYSSEAGEETVEVDEILLAAGKSPNTEKLNLMAAGVEINDKQAIVVQPNLQTSQIHIYAIGDVNNLPLRLETTAGREGTYSAENALNGTNKSIDYHSVPWTVFTDPQLASVGYTEDEQMAELKVCACRNITFDKLPKALITKRTEGVIKIAIHPETKIIMGVHILAPNAGDLIAQAMVLIKNKNTIDDLEDMLPVFPTLSEAIKLAAMSFTRDVSKMSCCI
ncbi:MAG: mercury(II) reductase [Patescibacteria group bacterium]|jgi:mercuric reductase|nr:mercury(II) reductase [Patescibacteria group bacterium]